MLKQHVMNQSHFDIWRTSKTMRIPVVQSDRYVTWMRCHWCGHAHATITYFATCCFTCKEKSIEIVDEYKGQRRMEWHQPKQPPIDAVDVVREYSWTKWGLLASQFIFKMTPAYLNAITTVKEELNTKRRGDPNGL